MDELPVRAAGGLNGFDHAAHARARLLRAAADVFDRKGYAAASVREIVEQAGATKPVLYYYFGSKEGLLLAILEEGSRQFQAALDRAIARPGSARERLATLCEEIYAVFRDNVPAVRVAHAMYFGPKAGMPSFDFSQFERMLDAAIGRVIEDGVTSGEIRWTPVDDVLTTIKGVVEISTDRELGRRAEQSASAEPRRILDLIFDGLSAARNDKEN